MAKINFMASVEIDTTVGSIVVINGDDRFVLMPVSRASDTMYALINDRPMQPQNLQTARQVAKAFAAAFFNKKAAKALAKANARTD